MNITFQDRAVGEISMNEDDIQDVKATKLFQLLC